MGVRWPAWAVAWMTVLLGLALAACGGRVVSTPVVLATRLAQATQGTLRPIPTSTPTRSTLVTLPPVDPARYAGTILAAGSSTVYPLAERMAERFLQAGFRGQITIDSIGSGAGFERFCVAGETDIANASRPIKPAEVANCRAIGREPLEFRVGTDALVVVVSRENDFVDGLTLEELALVFSTARTWQDVRPQWPDAPILRFSPGTDSGTFDFFVEHVFAKDEAPLLNAANLNLSEDDNVLVRGVESSPYAIGYFGFAYYLSNRDRLRAVPIEGVMPSAQSAEDGSYPLARPLLLYSDAAILRNKPQVAAFLNFFLTYVNQEIEAVGYFPASPEALNRGRMLWLQAMGMSPPQP